MSSNTKYFTSLAVSTISLFVAAVFFALNLSALADLPTQIPIAAGNNAPLVNAFYMSDVPVGSDSNNCLTVATPCATIGHMITIMAASPTIKRTYVMASGGTYNITTPINMNSAGGMTFQAYPGDKPVFDGGACTNCSIFLGSGTAGVTLIGLTCQNTGVGAFSDRACIQFSGGTGNHFYGNLITNTGEGMLLVGETNDIVQGNQFTNAGNGDAANGTCTPLGGGATVNCGGSAFEINGGDTGTNFSYNLVNGATGQNTHGGCVFQHGGSGETYSHNFCENAVGMGIGVEDFGSVNSNVTITYNLLLNTNTASNDSGCIYTLARTTANMGSTLIDHNYCSFPSTSSSTQIRAFYMDDCVSNTTWSNNISWNAGVGPSSGNGGSAVQIHVGSSNTVSNNIFGLGVFETSTLLSQSTGGSGSCSTTMAGNTWTTNIVYTTQTAATFGVSLTGQLAITGAQLWGSGTTWSNTSGQSGFTYSGVTTATNPGFTSPGGITIVSNAPVLGNWTASAALSGWNPIDTSTMGIAGAGVPVNHWTYTY